MLVLAPTRELAVQIKEVSALFVRRDALVTEDYPHNKKQSNCLESPVDSVQSSFPTTFPILSSNRKGFKKRLFVKQHAATRLTKSVLPASALVSKLEECDKFGSSSRIKNTSAC